MAEGGDAGAKPAFDFDLAFQGKVIRTLFQDGAFCAAVSEYLAPALFDGKIRRWLAGALLSHAKKYGAGASLDAVKMRLAKDLKTGRLLQKDAEEAETFVARLQKPVKDRSFVKDAIFEFVKNQVIKESILNSLDHLKVQDFVAVDREVSRILNVNGARDGGLGQNYVRDLDGRLKRRKKVAGGGISTGTKVDEYMRAGGLWRKAVGCIMGAYGSGKTSTLISFSRAAVLESTAKVLFITTELDEDMVAERFDAGFADVSLTDIEEEDDAVRQAVSELGTQHGEFLRIKFYPTGTLMVPMLRSYMLRLEGVGFYPDLLVIDTIENMAPTEDRRKDDAYEDQGNLYNEVRGFVGEKDIACWTASQLNREGIGREVATGKHASDSIKKPQVCDVNLVLNQTEKEKRAMIGRLLFDKNRGGPAGMEIPVRMDWSRALLTDRAA